MLRTLTLAPALALVLAGCVTAEQHCAGFVQRGTPEFQECVEGYQAQQARGAATAGAVNRDIQEQLYRQQSLQNQVYGPIYGQH